MIKLFFKGMAMGAADLVPGVSGGTVALITGIYQQLITSLSRIVDKHSLSLLVKGQWQQLWAYVNGSFLLVLGMGIILNALLLSHLISYLFEQYPFFIWSLFSGLVLGSIIALLKQYHPKRLNWLVLLLGVTLCLVISNSPLTTLEANYLTLFFVAMIAICAMLLPGISGSFILLLLGLYEPVIAIVKQIDIVPLMIFVCGALTGLLCFSKLLNWLMLNYHRSMIAFLSGLLVGSLPSLWPWKANFSLTSFEAMKLPWQVESLAIDQHIIMLALIVGAMLLVTRFSTLNNDTFE